MLCWYATDVVPPLHVPTLPVHSIGGSTLLNSASYAAITAALSFMLIAALVDEGKAITGDTETKLVRLTVPINNVIVPNLFIVYTLKDDFPVWNR
jgi:hypothetical protein